MGAADCITAVISYAHQYNTHNMHIKTQPHKHICIPIYKHTINKRKPKYNRMYFDKRYTKVKILSNL